MNLSYSVKFPESIPDGINDYLVEFDYLGNTASLYSNGLIIADDYYSGYKMPIGLRRFKEKLKDNDFIFQITPLFKDYDIYFENETELNFAEDVHALLKGVSITPEYQVKIKY